MFFYQRLLFHGDFNDFHTVWKKRRSCWVGPRRPGSVQTRTMVLTLRKTRTEANLHPGPHNDGYQKEIQYRLPSHQFSGFSRTVSFKDIISRRGFCCFRVGEKWMLLEHVVSIRLAWGRFSFTWPEYIIYCLGRIIIYHETYDCDIHIYIHIYVYLYTYIYARSSTFY